MRRRLKIILRWELHAPGWLASDPTLHADLFAHRAPNYLVLAGWSGQREGLPVLPGSSYLANRAATHCCPGHTVAGWQAKQAGRRRWSLLRHRRAAGPGAGKEERGGMRGTTVAASSCSLSFWPLPLASDRPLIMDRSLSAVIASRLNHLSCSRSWRLSRYSL